MRGNTLHELDGVLKALDRSSRTLRRLASDDDVPLIEKTRLHRLATPVDSIRRELLDIRRRASRWPKAERETENA